MARKHWYDALTEGARNPDAVVTWAEKFPAEWIECRDQGRHSYFRAHRRKIIGGFEEIWRCSRCPIWYRRYLNRQWQLVLREPPHYPKADEGLPSYLTPPGTGRLGEEGKAVLRKIEGERWLAEHAEDDEWDPYYEGDVKNIRDLLQ